MSTNTDGEMLVGLGTAAGTYVGAKRRRSCTVIEWMACATVSLKFEDSPAAASASGEQLIAPPVGVGVWAMGKAQRGGARLRAAASLRSGGRRFPRLSLLCVYLPCTEATAASTITAVASIFGRKEVVRVLSPAVRSVTQQHLPAAGTMAADAAGAGAGLLGLLAAFKTTVRHNFGGYVCPAAWEGAANGHSARCRHTNHRLLGGSARCSGACAAVLHRLLCLLAPSYWRAAPPAPAAGCSRCRINQPYLQQLMPTSLSQPLSPTPLSLSPLFLPPTELDLENILHSTTLNVFESFLVSAHDVRASVLSLFPEPHMST